VLRLSDISVELGGFALKVSSLELASGEYLVILGPNGAGKTVLLETIAGLHPVEQGRVEFQDATVDAAAEAGAHPPAGAGAPPTGAAWTDVTEWPPEKRRVGFVYQDYLLFPHLSVSDNIGFGLKGRVPAADRTARIHDAAALTGVEGLLGRRVGGLSGGEQQRVALARALAIHPRLLLLDEPLAALDRTARRGMVEDLRRLCRELGVTVLHVTHSLDEAVWLGDRVAVLAGGALLQLGTPEELLRGPATRQVAELVGCENLFDGVLAGSTVTVAGGPTLSLGDGRARGTEDGPTGGADRADTGRVTVAIRGEDLSLLPPAGHPEQVSSGLNLFPAVVEAVEPGPAHWTVKVRYAAGPAGSAGADVGSAGTAESAPTFTVFVLPPDIARLGLFPGAAVQVGVEPARVWICPAWRPQVR
jgi:ABC-type Fe3+/spermidine/putrescine transport system ATPase subunit